MKCLSGFFKNFLRFSITFIRLFDTHISPKFNFRVLLLYVFHLSTHSSIEVIYSPSICIISIEWRIEILRTMPSHRLEIKHNRRGVIVGISLAHKARVVISFIIFFELKSVLTFIMQRVYFIAKIGPLRLVCSHIFIEIISIRLFD